MIPFDASAKMQDVPEHPILPRAFEWRVVELHWRGDPPLGSPKSIDLHLYRDGVIRRLRFVKPHQFTFHQEGLPVDGIKILDIRCRCWEGMNIEVGNIEQDERAPRFLAEDVFDLDDPANELRKIETE